MNDTHIFPHHAGPGVRSAHDFDATLRAHGTARLRRAAATTLQINVGKLCNQACLHCHVDAGPKRTEQMRAEVAEHLLWLVERSPAVETVDITGGAPELNPCFRRLVTGARALGRHVIDRCNLTVLSEPGQEDLADFLAEHRVEVIASLPCYSPGNVDQQRGKGVFARSIDALQRLNALGYASPGTGLALNLVYNPLGASLPPDQTTLEADYKIRLRDDFGIEFDHLYTLTNLPIARFLHSLRREGKLDDYMTLLASSFNPATVDGLMCRHQISVGYTGKLYDCDFNQMLELGLPPSPPAPLPDAASPLGEGSPGRPPRRMTQQTPALGAGVAAKRPGAGQTIFDLDSFDTLAGRPIATDAHCFGCTAGAGSSCGGALG